MNNLEHRVYRLEQDVAKLKDQMVDVLRRLARLEQQQWANGGGGGGGGGSSGSYIGCVLSAGLTHGSSLTNQTVYQVNPAGTRVNLSTTATVYNDGPTASNDIASAATVILMPNPDSTYTVCGVYC